MLKFILKYKKCIIIATLITSAPTVVYIKAEGHMYSDNEEKFLHEAIHNLLAYVKDVQEGKDQFFNLSNKESYEAHIRRFKTSLEFINTIAPTIANEAKNHRAHSSKEFSETIRTIHHIVTHLKTAQQKWVEAVDTHRNVISLGIALKQLEPMAAKIKNEVTLRLVPALESHLSDHALIAQAEEIKQIVMILFANDIGFIEGSKFITHRLKY